MVSYSKIANKERYSLKYFLPNQLGSNEEGSFPFNFIEVNFIQRYMEVGKIYVCEAQAHVCTGSCDDYCDT